MKKSTPITITATTSSEQAQEIMRQELLSRSHFVVSPLQRQVGGNHYKADVIQHVEFCQKNKLTWCESAALKYMMRHRRKNGKEDILKAIHYLELLLEIEYPDPKIK